MQKTEVKNRFTPPANWSTALLLANPIFADLCQRFGLAQLTQYPDVAWLNQHRSQSAVSFVDNDALSADGRYYEEYIYATAQVPTRKDNWHDFFGALIWNLFPQTKALLNQLHMAEIAQHGLKQRSKLRNKLTLFDECGVVICLEPAANQHADLLRAHQWQQSFVARRSDWQQQVRPIIFGHAIYEMATAPFIGLTAKALFIEVPDGFSQWSLTAAYSFIDNKLHEQIANQALLIDNRQLTPLPILGVPGWYNENETTSFYHNTNYFRPRRKT
ncbi:MAG: DUF3025 domain-containing protein [Gammaproteobacteria bacterium]|nr:DUF3025 domain-containing protein [Gammaproteobacteria bacterium]MBU1556900.1 DUF3025 domain-containing protein [Gammaproteobacteria bacterium]MBU2071235.1 DUF3025 domain-containing protein [Gammaproteobacteria bacterium]MBU2181642.1 DUF3025 domain-containing protein [Gammaproteobacteria bacterium]MBU2205371.1 DUF3025 domain-containing protein [Gammaproteobacteria bacterium]